MTVVAGAGGSLGAPGFADRTELWERLTLVGRVLKLQLIVTWSIRLTLAGLALDCLWLGGSRVFPYIVPVPLLPAVPLALVGLGALTLTFWRPSMAFLARNADRQLSLKERLTTAVELQTERSSAGGADGVGQKLAGLQLQDAIGHFRHVEPVEAFPIRISLKELNIALALAIVAIVLVVVPNSMQQTVRQREQVQRSIKQEAERLNKLAEQVAELNVENPSEELQHIEQALREAAHMLNQGSMNGEEALAALSALEQRLQALQGQGNGDLEEALSSLAGSLAQDPTTRQLGTSLARGDYKQAAEDLRRLAEQIDSLSPAERARLARSLRQAGQRASRANQGLAQSLSQSANALEQGNVTDSQNALGNTAGQIERAAGQLRAGNERERAMSQLQQSRSAVSRSVQQQQSQARGQPGSRQPGSRGSSSSESGEDGDSQAGPGSNEGDPSAGDRPGGSSAGTGSNPRSEEIYDPAFASSRQERLNEGQPFTPTDSYDNPNPEDPYRNDAQVGYSQVYARYQDKAVQSLQNSYIPVGLKDLVKDYFSSLSPGK